VVEVSGSRWRRDLDLGGGRERRGGPRGRGRGWLGFG
jgi:hypothetical protein